MIEYREIWIIFMAIILNEQQLDVLEKNMATIKEIKNKAIHSSYVSSLTNISIKPSQLGTMATWKIYQINRPSDFNHTPCDNYMKYLNLYDMTEAAKFIHPSLIQENYVVNKIKKLKKILAPYEITLELFQGRTIDTSYTATLYIKEIDSYIYVDFISTNSDNIIAIIESQLSNHPYMLSKIRITTEAIKEKKLLEQSMKYINNKHTKIKL
jgi:hypothetical protein